MTNQVFYFSYVKQTKNISEEKEFSQANPPVKSDSTSDWVYSVETEKSSSDGNDKDDNIAAAAAAVTELPKPDELINSEKEQISNAEQNSEKQPIPDQSSIQPVKLSTLNTLVENLTQKTSNQAVSNFDQKVKKPNDDDDDEIIVENIKTRKIKMTPREAMKILGSQ